MACASVLSSLLRVGRTDLDCEVSFDAGLRYCASMIDAFPGRRKLVVLAVLFEGGLALVALALGWALNQAPLQYLRWDLRKVALGVAATIPMLTGLFLCLTSKSGPLLRIRRLLDDIVGPLFKDLSAAEVALIALLAGFGEEMLFRGVLQDVFARWLGVWGSVAALNVLFGLLHSVTPLYGIVAGAAGVYLSCVFLWCGNLWAVIVPHALFDLAGLLYVVYRPGTQPRP
jgi:uncharacterized protein